MTTAQHDDPRDGVLFSATGPERYFRLAERAARSIKQTNPGLAVDIYTDKAYESDAFDCIHVLEDAWIRSKIDVMANCRFERALMLDADILVLADIRDVFEVLERFDIALVHDQERNGPSANRIYRKTLPGAYPQFNGGVIALRRSPQTRQFLQDWSQAVKDHDIGRDQPSLRELLWDSDLRIATLPPEYNLMHVEVMQNWTRFQAAPRILHSPQFHNQFERYARAADPVTERLGLRLGWRVPQMIAADKGLAKLAGTEPVPAPEGPKAYLAYLAWALPKLPKRLFSGIKRVVMRRLTGGKVGGVKR